jgi:PAS domain S-box-containing protein
MSKKRLPGAAKKTSPSATANFRTGGKTDAFMRAVFPGDSETAGRMRDFDWDTTDLGPPQNWPENLRITVRICLTSRFPIVVWWGPNYTMFYNDAYISFLGRTKHPQWLGRSGKQCWQEIWPVIGPMLEGVWATGQATWSQDLLLFLDRNLPQEEGYFTFSYSPILDNQNNVNGIFCACFETTEQVVSTRRLETLRKLGVQTLEMRAVDTACEEAARVLAENSYDIPFAAIYLINDAGTQAELKSLAGFNQNDHPFPSSISVSEGDIFPWPLASALQTRRVAETSDLTGAGLRLPGGPWPEPASKAITLPIFAAERESLSGLAVLGVSPRRVLDDSYRTFFSLIAGHIGTGISDARAYEAEQKRAEALAELDRAKTAFFSNVSHEFRTPLTLMLGPLEDELRENPAARDRLEIAHRNSLRLLKLVNTLLDFSRIEAGRIEASFEPTDLAALTSELASVFRSAIEKAGLRLVVDCPPLPEPVYVDREMWEKIVLNLLSNAFKFTFEGEIKVALRRRNKRVELSVSDTGVGIPKSELPKIFQRFHRARGAKSRTYEGTGIGLALAQELARLHGGEIKARSREGEGSTFTVIVQTGVDHLPADRISAARQLSPTKLGALPFVEDALRWLPDETVVGSTSSASDESPHEVESMENGQPAADKPRVLVADDNADMRAYVKRLLGQRYHVEVVPDGQAALEAARSRPPDLALTDVMMPGLDGFGLLKELRADERTRAIPVIMLSARAGAEARVEGLYAGADDYLTKPFSASELVARVDSQLAMARLRRESEERVRGVNADLNRRVAELERANVEIRDSRRAAFNLMEDAVMAQEALRRKQEQLDAALSASDTGAFCWNPFTDEFLEVDQHFKRLWGFAPDDHVRGAQDLIARVHPEDAPEFARAIDRRRNGNDLNQEYRIIHSDGSVHWLLIRARVERDAEGLFTYVNGACTDITERKQSETAAAQLAAIIESSDDAIISKDLNGNVVSWNRGAEKLFGYTAAEIIGKSVMTLFPADREDEEPRIIERIRRGEQVSHYETVRRHKDGHEIAVSLSVSPIRDKAGKVIGASKIARDISERKRIEAEREEMLLKESAARAEAEAANHSKDEFLAIVSHELRSPLNAILGYNRMLRERSQDETYVKQSCDIIERNARTQLQLIEDLLDTARIVSGKLKLELRNLDIIPVLADALDIVRLAAETKGVKLRIADCGLRIADARSPNNRLKITAPVGSGNQYQTAPRESESAIVLGDAARLQQIVWNLLSNAIKFTPAGGSVELRAERDEERIRIIISDTGKGIQPEFIPYVFDRFRQRDSSSSQRSGGLGLGLALAQHLADLHGGKVEAASEGAGCGATFTFTMPLVTQSEAPAEGPPVLSAWRGPIDLASSRVGTNGDIQLPTGLTIAGTRVLVVDDQEEARATLSDFLNSCGAVVMTASSGAEALTYLSNPPDGDPPDVLLCDIAMPGEDGYAALRRVRALEEARGVAALNRIPAIALTGLTGARERLRALSAGFHLHIAKPVDPVELMLVIANIVGMRQEAT